MDNEIVIQLAKFNDKTTTNNSSWSNNTTESITINEGDQILVSKAFIDTRDLTSANITIEKDIGWMSWLDYGMFIQNICIAARAYDLDTCPQAAWGQMHNTLSPLLNIKDNHIIHCGISLGWEDKTAKVNKLVTVREPLDSFTIFHET